MRARVKPGAPCVRAIRSSDRSARHDSAIIGLRLRTMILIGVASGPARTPDVGCRTGGRRDG